MSTHSSIARRAHGAWLAFRRWRGSRPFWGGLLSVLAGVDILLAPLAPLPLLVQQGIAGVSSYVVGLLLIAIGVLAWLQPAQRIFYGIVAILLALASFVTSNFGGFLIGMLLGLVGGSLIFGWLPEKRPRRRSGGRRGEPPTDTDAPQGVDGAGEADTVSPTDSAGDTVTPPTHRLPPSSPPQPGPDRLHSTLALTTAVALAMAPSPALGLPWDDWFGSGDSGQSPSPSPSPSASVSPSARPSGAVSPSASSAPSETPSPSPGTGAGGGQPPSDSTGGAQEGDAADDTEEEGEEQAADCEIQEGAPAEDATEEEFRQAVEACQSARENGQSIDVAVTQSEQPWTAGTADTGLTADSLTMIGASFDGVVEYPTADGPRRFLKLSMDSARFEAAEQFFYRSGTRITLEHPQLRMDGDVVMHVTKMRASILGLELTFTPDFPPPLLLPVMYVTELEVDQPLAQADQIDISGLNEYVNL
ncbi:DUF6114 domain-containing protein [Salinactinospora qingdaonensis]|uniref:Uncharacterized protein n=1 Tax=Salinactinospora qingdaonensis TaxID=702744 RepID=A0ABP7EYR7_9ACTN